jgi:predicted MPP superfamily phosphohydrolase
MKDIAPSLEPLAQQAPTYAVMGNHDHVDNSPALTRTALNKAGIKLLFNANEEISLRDDTCKFRLVGISDDFAGVASPSMALNGIQEGETKIGLTHSPTIYPDVHQDVDLLVAGHTHGGVACIPFTRYCISRFSSWGSEWVNGIYQPDGFHSPMLINSGVGNSILPLRFSSPAGYDIITLQRGGKTPDAQRD